MVAVLCRSCGALAEWFGSGDVEVIHVSDDQHSFVRVSVEPVVSSPDAGSDVDVGGAADSGPAVQDLSLVLDIDTVYSCFVCGREEPHVHRYGGRGRKLLASDSGDSGGREPADQ